MSSVVISGDTSGTLTLTVPAVAGTNTLTLPAVTGTIVTNKTAGTILQVVSANFTGFDSTTSTTFVASSLTVTITPTSATSKIYINASALAATLGTNICYLTLYRNSTNLGNATNGMASASNAVFSDSVPMTYLDSPATTSATTYTVYFRTNSSTAYAGGTNQQSTITVMEVAS